MSNIPFSELNLTPKVERAILEMGFDLATPIQSQAIPLIRTGVDVIAHSQTGTGKTVAYAIPAIERIDTHEDNPTVQVLILCPTRELAQQVTDEIRKVARFKTGIRPVEIYGGAPMDKQCMRLRRANIVVGTPGRVMDHMRRKTLKFTNLKMVVLDEADEMLNMGFKEDIETILMDTPVDRQMVLLSATMPPSIMKLTEQFQKSPKLIEIDKGQMTIEGIDQSYIDIPHNKKKDALLALLRFYKPQRAIIFCNTKIMVDELDELLLSQQISAEKIHSDIRQSRRTAVMQNFKHGRTSILLATDIAARGIDVSDVDFVINFDLPVNSEYYIHRIGRTGRAGKSGRSITLCSGRREVSIMRNIAFDAKSVINKTLLPTADEIKNLDSAKLISAMEECLQGKLLPICSDMVSQLTEKGYSERQIAEAALQLSFEKNVYPEDICVDEEPLKAVPSYKEKKPAGSVKLKPSKYDRICIDIGSIHHVAPNHIVGALTEHSELHGSDIGKVEVFPTYCLVEIPAGTSDEVIDAMVGCKIRGKGVKAEARPDFPKTRHHSSETKRFPKKSKWVK